MAPRLIYMPFVVAAICGCAAVSDRISTPGALGTRVGVVRRLAEPVDTRVSLSPLLAISGTAQPVSVALNFPDSGSECTVVRQDWLGDAKCEAVFPCGQIVSRVFRNVAEAMFHVAEADESPVAIFRVRILRATASASSGGVVATVGLGVEIARPEGGAACFSGAFESTASAPWSDMNSVPDAFYRALESLVADFAAKWGVGGAVAIMRKWRGEMAPEIVPPSLRAIEWTRSGDAWVGSCEVLCNGYEGFEAKAWANARIAAACRAKLGGIDPERVRIVCDEESYDVDTRRWTLQFRTFPRTAIVLSFNMATRQGAVTGDLELMGMTVGQASEELKRFVQDEMDSRAGKVSREKPKGCAELRFDDFTMDKAYDLVTIRFRLL